MLKSISTLVVCLWAAIPASAQTIPVDLMPIVELSDRIMIGKESMPRCTDLPKTKRVAFGETYEPAFDELWDCVEVAGTLKFSRTHDTKFRTTHLVTLKSGTVDVGTVADPIPAARKVEIIGADVAINTVKDPFQWGNGWLNFGHRYMHGAKKQEWCPLTAEIKKGAQTVTLACDPTGWLIDDELLAPDTDQPQVNTPPKRETKMTVAGISGRTITLSKPFDFDHLAVRDPDGGTVLLPRIANLTRNIIVRSENPAGTPWHVADVGHASMWDDRYVAYIGLGRTKAERLDNTTNEPVHIGLNQVGRYAVHHHHAMGFGSASVGDVLIGTPTSGKWGAVFHGVHDSLFDRMIAIDFLGAGFSLEDGYEMRDVLHQNFGAYNLNPANYGSNPDVALHNVQDLNAPGIEGACIWARANTITLDGNECWANGTGINMFNIAQVAGSYPSVPGGVNDTTFTPNPDGLKAMPVLVTGNVTAANMHDGLESWGLRKFPNINLISAYNGHAQADFVISNPTQIYLVNPTLIAKGGTTLCNSSSASYTETLEIERGSFRGCAIGVTDGGAIRSVKITGTLMQNVTDFQYDASAVSIIHDGVIQKAMPGRAPQFWLFGRSLVWPGPPRPLDGPPSANTWFYQRGQKIHVIRNHQGIAGNDFRLIHPQQAADTLAWPTEFQQHQYGTPEAGLTMGAVWSKYGISWGGEAVDRANAVPLVGLVGPGFAVKGGAIPFGPPKAVLTYPNSYTPAVISHDSGGAPYIELDGLVTGDPAAASQDFVFSVDGAAPITMQSFPEWEGDQRKYGIRNGMANGAHSVKTWRTTTAGVKIAASELTFTYSVGAVTPPVMTTVPNVVGQTQTAATAQLVAAKLTAVIGTPVNNPAAVGLVVSESPAAGDSVAVNTAVSLVLSLGPVVTPPVDVWMIILGSASGASLQQFVAGGIPQPRFRICSTPASCSELVVKP